MSLLQLYRDDLLVRFPSHTFTETVVGDMTKVEFFDGASALVFEAQKLDATDAYKNIRENLVGTPAEFMFCATVTQRDAMTGVLQGTQIFQETDKEIEAYNGVEWRVIGGGEWQTRPATTIQTTDGTQTVIDSFTLDDNETYMIQINVVCTESTFTQRGAWIKTATLYRSGGVATIQGLVTANHDVSSRPQYEADITVSGNLVEASVTGFAGDTVDWKCSLQFIEQ